MALLVSVGCGRQRPETPLALAFVVVCVTGWARGVRQGGWREHGQGIGLLLKWTIVSADVRAKGTLEWVIS